MNDIPIEDIHRLLDLLNAARVKVEGQPTKNIQVQLIPELSEVILECLDWTNTAYVENRLGVNPAILSKFVKMRGVVSTKQALHLTDRLRTYLKSEDQRTDATEILSPQVEVRRIRSVGDGAAPTRLKVQANEWVQIAFSSEIKAKIAVISSLLDSIIEQIARANAPEEDQILTKLERQQLITVLETAVAVLKAPMVERGILQTARDILSKGAKSAVEKSVQQAAGIMMENAVHRLGELIALIFKSVS